MSSALLGDNTIIKYYTGISNKDNPQYYLRKTYIGNNKRSMFIRTILLPKKKLTLYKCNTNEHHLAYSVTIAISVSGNP
jgi:hypothetical protein